MKPKFRTNLLFLVVTAGSVTSKLSAAPSSAYLDGLYFDKPGTPLGNTYLTPFDATYNSRSIDFSSWTGGLFLFSGANETLPGNLDGGITLAANPISLVLSNNSSSNPDDANLNVWKVSAWGVGQPLFNINGLNGNTTFTNSNVAINNGSLSVSGSQVLTTNSPPPTTAAWTAAFVSRGNVINNAVLALGTGTASSNGAVALSNAATASGFNSLATGSGASATSTGSIAMGALAKTYAQNSVAIGYSAQAGTSGSTVGLYSVAFGNSAKTSADYSIALGTQSESSGKYAVSIGAGKATGILSLATTGGHSDGDVSIALGGWWSNGTSATSPGPNTSAGLASAAIGGFKNTVTGKAAYASGVFNSPSAAVSTTFGSAAIGGGSSSVWVENEPLFELGNTAVDLTAPVEPTTGRTNAVTVLKNGQTTLTNKAWKANVVADPNTSVTALANPTSATDSDGNALVVDGHTVLNGKVVISVPQGDIAMGIYGN